MLTKTLNFYVVLYIYQPVKILNVINLYVYIYTVTYT